MIIRNHFYEKTFYFNCINRTDRKSIFLLESETHFLYYSFLKLFTMEQVEIILIERSKSNEFIALSTFVDPGKRCSL